MRSREMGGMAVTVLVAVGLTIAGCGGGDDGDAGGDTGGDSPSKAEFIKQADAICKKAHDEFEKEFRQAFRKASEQTNENLKRFALTTLVPGNEGEIRDISALEPPAGSEAEVKAIIAAVQTGVDKIKADPGILLPSVPEDPLAKGHRLAKQYGMKECSV